MCIYVSNALCSSSAITGQLCSPDLEFIIFTVVCIPPQANTEFAVAEQYETTTVEFSSRGFVFVTAGDFNHANLKTVLPRFYQFLDLPTRGNNKLDHVNCNIPNAYNTLTPTPLLPRLRTQTGTQFKTPVPPQFRLVLTSTSFQYRNKVDQFAHWANRSAEDAVSMALHMSGHIWDTERCCTTRMHARPLSYSPIFTHDCKPTDIYKEEAERLVRK